MTFCTGVTASLESKLEAADSDALMATNRATVAFITGCVACPSGLERES